MGGSIHEKPVEVQACALIAELIDDIDHNTVSYSSPDLGDWPLAVDTNGRSFESTVRVRCDPGDIEVVGDNSSTNK